MKENGIEKLLDLLNEYDDNNWGVTDYGVLFNKMDEGISETEYLQVISKKFGFIQWLVKNKRIDFDKLKPLTGVTEIMLATNCPDIIEVERRYRLYEQLIMLLSISDNPISDLISYLK